MINSKNILLLLIVIGTCYLQAYGEQKQAGDFKSDSDNYNQEQNFDINDSENEDNNETENLEDLLEEYDDSLIDDDFSENLDDSAPSNENF